jgi:predicted transcriptional regulator
MLNKIQEFQQIRPWLDELRLFKAIREEHSDLSVRDLAELIKKSKSWTDRSIQLLNGLDKYPYLKTESNRNSAYVYIQKRKK